MGIQKNIYSVWFTLILFLPLIVACVNDEEDRKNVEFLKTGSDVPGFELTDINGKRLSSSMLNGQIYILNFFDTACPDCQQELQTLQAIYDKYGETVPVLNVPRNQTTEQVSAYWKEKGLTVPFYSDGDQKLYYQFATQTVPRTYIIDSTGKVNKTFTDSPIADFDTLDATLHELLTQTEGEVNISLRLNVAPSTRMMDDFYFHNEYTISKLEVFLFNAETKEFVDKKTIYGLIQLEDTPYTQYDITYVFKNMRMMAGIYDIYAIANYDYSPDSFTDEFEFLNMVDSVTYKAGIEANIPDTGPVMTNRTTALLGVDFIPYIGRDYILQVEMERVMAKLQIGVAKNTFVLKHNQQKYADINITNYKLVNLNTRYYLFQHKDTLPEFSSRTSFEMPQNFDNYYDKNDSYVVDPYFYEKTGSLTDAQRIGKFYNSWFGAFTTEYFAPMPSAENHGYAYILENTVYKDYQKNGYTPGIVFQAAVSPVFVYLYNSSQRTLIQEFRPEYWPKTIYFYNYTFYGSIQALNVDTGLSLDELMNYTDAQLKTYGIKQCKFNMGVYETYYTYWIRHRNTPNNHTGPMEYGIVRNNFYKMIVSGVTGIGNSSITPDILRDNYPNSYADVEIRP